VPAFEPLLAERPPLGHCDGGALTQLSRELQAVAARLQAQVHLLGATGRHLHWTSHGATAFRDGLEEISRALHRVAAQYGAAAEELLGIAAASERR
jgi:hypothetical protein